MYIRFSKGGGRGGIPEFDFFYYEKPDPLLVHKGCTTFSAIPRKGLTIFYNKYYRKSGALITTSCWGHGTTTKNDGILRLQTNARFWQV